MDKHLPYLNDQTSNPPRLRTEINWFNLEDLQSESFPVDPSDPEARLSAILQGGFEGVNAGSRELCGARGVPTTAGFRADTVAELRTHASEAQNGGHDAAGIHLGTGLENWREACRLYEAVCAISEELAFPLYVETHRATLTQDIYRAVELCQLFPEVRYLGDFSHWWTGLEWHYGDSDAKIEFVAPMLERVGMLQGRIGTAGSIQVRVDDLQAPNVCFFRKLWTRSMESFLKLNKPGSVFVFASELLPEGICYARKFPDGNGQMIEESDRWQQALLLRDLAIACWEQAQQNTGITAISGSLTNV